MRQTLAQADWKRLGRAVALGCWRSARMLLAVYAVVVVMTAPALIVLGDYQGVRATEVWGQRRSEVVAAAGAFVLGCVAWMWLWARRERREREAYYGGRW